MPRTDYASEKLRVATETLASGGNVKDNLMSVSETLSRLQEKDFEGIQEGALAQRFKEIMDRLSSGSTYEASIAALSDDEAGELAADIVQLAFANEREFGGQIALRSGRN